MHVPDGFLDAPTSIGTAVVAAGGVALALRGARRDLDDRMTPIAGLVAVFIFAGQMLSFPVGAGTSGHLLADVSPTRWPWPGNARKVTQRHTGARSTDPGAATVAA